MRFDLKLNENAAWALVVMAVAVVCIVIALSGEGCQNTQSVTCADGATYSTQEIGGDPGLSAGDAEKFCEKHGGVTG